MEQYPNNSHAFKEKQATEASKETIKIEKVVSSPVKIKKKSGLQKYIDGLVPEGTPDFKTHILKNVLWPIVKDGAFEVVCTLFNKPKGKSSGSFIDKVSYGAFWKQNKPDPRDKTVSSFRSGFEGVDNIVLANRGEAEMVLSTMDDVIDRYGHVTVAALFDMLDVTCPYTCENYGWVDLSAAKVVSVRDGYLLDLPRPRVLR